VSTGLSQSNPVNAIAIDPDHGDTIFIGCDVGIFRSDNAGSTWSAWDSGLPNCSVQDLQFFGHFARFFHLELIRASEPFDFFDAGRLVLNPPIIAGLFCYAISVVVWILALARVEVSVAYPMLSVGYVLNALAAWWLFGENLSATRIAGIGIILIGVWLVARSAGPA
jgi:multidrug transporter EmrE-like cation transporter